MVASEPVKEAPLVKTKTASVREEIIKAIRARPGA
jgi:hypothetical protein